MCNKNAKLFLLIFLVVCLFSIKFPKSEVAAQSPTYKVGIQAGHWQSAAGARSCDKKVAEEDITLAIARLAVQMLASKGITAEVLPAPATYSHNYEADAFVALHTDYCAGNNSGFKVSRWNGSKGTGLDGSGDTSDLLTQNIWDEYEKATGLPRDTSTGHFAPCFVTYYALNPVEGGRICIGDPDKETTQIHGIADTTPGAIIEMGWLSGDLIFMTTQDGQNKMAAGIANGILSFLNLSSSKPLTNNNASSTVLVFDTSGSMADLDASGISKIEAAQHAGTNILDVISAENRASSPPDLSQVGAVGYSDTPYVISQITSDVDSVKALLPSMMPTASTGMAGGLKTGIELFGPGSGPGGKIIILLSDGLPNIGWSGGQNDLAAIQQEVLDLAGQAGNQGICVFTVGFGDPAAGAGSIDEDFLKQVASASGCGEYYNARNSIDLANIYVELRHTSTGTILLNQSGQIAQGEQIDLGSIAVAQNQSTMLFTLNWPGSKLEPTILDPVGVTVDENYPGASISSSASLVSVIISNPPPGDWKVRILGADVPEGQTDYKALLSTRQGPVAVATATAAPTEIPAAPVEPSSAPLALVTVLIAGGLVGVYAYSRSLKRSARLAGGSARLRGISGLVAGQTFTIRDGDTLGRGSRNAILLKDPAVSREHAVIRYADGAWFIRDAGSSGGVYVNGQRVTAIRLNPGDQVCLGDQVFIFELG